MIHYDPRGKIELPVRGQVTPHEEVIHLGRAVAIRIVETSEVGIVARCYATQGVIERSATVRVIRDGIVVYPPPGRTANLDLVRCDEEDCREVHAGSECIMRVAGYGEVRRGDVIEAYRVDSVWPRL